jgi:hypothetical protein
MSGRDCCGLFHRRGYRITEGDALTILDEGIAGKKGAGQWGRALTAMGDQIPLTSGEAGETASARVVMDHHVGDLKLDELKELGKSLNSKGFTLIALAAAFATLAIEGFIPKPLAKILLQGIFITVGGALAKEIPEYWFDPTKGKARAVLDTVLTACPVAGAFGAGLGLFAEGQSFLGLTGAQFAPVLFTIDFAARLLLDDTRKCKLPLGAHKGDWAQAVSDMFKVAATVCLTVIPGTPLAMGALAAASAASLFDSGRAYVNRLWTRDDQHKITRALECLEDTHPALKMD